MQTLDLAQAEAIAIRQSPTISAAQFRALAAKQVVRQVRSAFFPQITGEISAKKAAKKAKAKLGAKAKPAKRQSPATITANKRAAKR